jgi:uncharacterized membrane protein
VGDTKIRGVSAGTAGKALGWGLAAYVLSFFFLAHLKYTYCTSQSADIAIFNHAYWATLHGKFFPVYAMGTSWYGDKTGFLLLLLLPVYWLKPDPHTLFFLSSLLIGLSAIPIYLLALHVWRDRSAAVLMAGGYLFFPTIVSQHVNQIQMMQFAVALVVLALYFLLIKRYRLFLLSCACALLLGTEDVGLTILMFLPYLALKRRWRDIKWAAAAAALVVVWYLVAFKLIMPIFRGNLPYRPLAYLSNLGNSPGEIIRTLLLDPERTFGSLLTGENLMYLIIVLQPLLWITPWCSAEAIFVVPYLSLNLLASNQAMKNVAWHYNVTVGMFLIVATVFTVRKWAGALARRWGPFRYEVGFALLFLCLAVTSWPFWLNLSALRPRPYYDAQRAAMHIVPPDESVIAPETMVAHFSGRERFHTLLGIEHWGGDLRTYDYIVLDGNDRMNDPLVTPDFVRSLGENPAYQLIFNQKNVFVFHRKQS